MAESDLKNTPAFNLDSRDPDSTVTVDDIVARIAVHRVNIVESSDEGWEYDTSLRGGNKSTPKKNFHGLRLKTRLKLITQPKMFVFRLASFPVSTLSWRMRCPGWV